MRMSVQLNLTNFSSFFSLMKSFSPHNLMSPLNSSHFHSARHSQQQQQQQQSYDNNSYLFHNNNNNVDSGSRHTKQDFIKIMDQSVIP